MLQQKHKIIKEKLLWLVSIMSWFNNARSFQLILYETKALTAQTHQKRLWRLGCCIVSNSQKLLVSAVERDLSSRGLTKNSCRSALGSVFMCACGVLWSQLNSTTKGIFLASSFISFLRTNFSRSFYRFHLFLPMLGAIAESLLRPFAGLKDAC